jgi:hypothetical protein
MESVESALSHAPSGNLAKQGNSDHKKDFTGVSSADQSMLNFYHQNYIRTLVSQSMDPLTKATTENLEVVINLKDQLKKLQRDFEFEQAYVKSTFAKMCTI